MVLMSGVEYRATSRRGGAVNMRFRSLLTSVLPVVAFCCGCAGAVVASEAFTIIDAINQAVQSNPGVGESAANRRATEAGLRQSQGALLPQVRLNASAGTERFNEQDIIPPPQGNKTWLNARSGSIVVRQILFDGFSSLNEIWRQAARVDAAAYRVHEQTELIALDAAEAYIDIIRFTRLIVVASDNLAAHRRLLGNVEARFRGGRSGEGDLEQTRERVAAAEAALADFQQSLDQARGTYRKVVGLEPFNLRAPGRLGGLPATKDDALATALRFNPTIRAAQEDSNAAKYAFHGTTGSFLPNVAFEGSALRAENSDTIFGRRSDESAKVVLSWDIFRGGQDSWKRVEMAERYTEATMAHARLQRAAFESLDKAWAARTITSTRIAALLRQVAADRLAINAYTKEYELGQRSLIDLLNAENQLFGALVSLESTRAVAILADYQLLAAMGQLLAYLKAPAPVDAAPLDSVPIGIFPVKLPPLLVKLPKSGSEPLNVAVPSPYVSRPLQYASENATDVINRRWSGWAALPEPGQWSGAPAEPRASASIGTDWPSNMMAAPFSRPAAH
jgi:adhesin transport system outer membrane protein